MSGLAASDVFGISRDVPLNYVVRTSVDGELLSALTRDKHLVIYGSSKQGKTTVRKWHLREDESMVVTCSNRWTLGQLHEAILKQAGYTVVLAETRSSGGNQKVSVTFGGAAAGLGRDKSRTLSRAPLELDPFDVNEIISALAAITFQRWIVLEDFHYLPEQTQKDFAIALKAFHESSQITFIIVAVWLQENRLTQLNGDLAGRVSTINADRWEREELLEAIRLGQEHLNVEFTDEFKDRLMDCCFDSIYVVQEVCLQACESSGLTQRGDSVRTVRSTESVDELIMRVVHRQTAKYREFLENFVRGFGPTELEMYRWVLLPVLTASTNELQRGISYSKVRQLIVSKHPRGQELNIGNVTQALVRVAAVQIAQGVQPLVLDYDQSLRVLNVVDKSFLIWLDQQDRQELLEALGLPSP